MARKPPNFCKFLSHALKFIKKPEVPDIARKLKNDPFVDMSYVLTLFCPSEEATQGTSTVNYILND